MPTKRQKRSEKKLKNIKKQKKKYPELIGKIVGNSDIILEILDARFIEDTRNIEIEKSIKKQGKKIIYVINKSDLIKEKNQAKLPIPYVFVSALKRDGGKKLRDLIKKQAKKIKEPEQKKIIIGVIGYPNIGKSSVINLLIGKSSAKTGAEAGFTKGIQKLRLNSEIVLLDSPGVIPEKEYSGAEKKAIAKHTKLSARGYSQVKDPETVIANFIKEFPGILEKHYKIKANGNSEILLEKLGRKHNFLKKAGKVNFDKTARLILKHWQEGSIKI